MGMFGILLIFGVLFVGCDNGSTDEEEEEVEETFTDVSGSIKLATGTGLNPADLTVESARKDKTTGITTIVLAGNAGTTLPTGLAEDFGSPHSGAPTTGSWSALTLEGIISEEAQAADTVIKQTNQSFRYYVGGPDVTDDEDDLSETGLPNIFVNESDIYKVKKYSGSPTFPSGSSFDILIWSGATVKTATLEITPDGGSKYIIIVDWSGVTFTAS
jgi:hypothetical protein